MDTYKVSGNIVDKQVMDELILLDLETGDYHALNETAAFIWKNARNEVSTAEIAQNIQKEFNIELAEAQSDVKDVFDQLKGLGFIE